MSDVFVGGEFNVLEWLYINILRVEHSEDGCNRFFFSKLHDVTSRKAVIIEYESFHF